MITMILLVQHLAEAANEDGAQFFDADLSAVVTHCTTSEIRFKVKGRGGCNYEWVPIKSFSLDAEL
ncbi:MAG TPA: hypothetical protein VKD23_10015 [Terriglobales bacterium]|nr:hypothetical protein [Terriglobales bacterium]